MGKTECTRAALAYHEAGHAVMGWRLGRRFRAISIVPSMGSGGRVCFDEPLGRDTDPAHKKTSVGTAVMIYVAGPLAAWSLERRFRTVHGLVDLTRAEQLIRQNTSSTKVQQTCLTQLKERAWNILAEEDCWRAVVSLADALARYRKLTGKTARAIIETAYFTSRTGGARSDCDLVCYRNEKKSIQEERTTRYER